MQTRTLGTLYNNAIFKHLEFEEPLKQLYKSDVEDITKTFALTRTP